MRASAVSAASSARLAMSILNAVSRPSTSGAYNRRSPGMAPNSSGSGNPACGSSVVISANSTAERTRCAMPSARQVGGVSRAGLAADQDAQSGRARPGLLEILQLAHAHVGGELIPFGDGALGVGGTRPPARGCTTSCGQFQQVILGQAVPPTVIRSILMVGMPTPTGTLWPSLPQTPMPSSRLQIVAHHADVLERLRAVADQRGVAHRAGQLAIFDQIAFGGREDEIAAGDIHLAAAEIGAVQALRHRAHDILRDRFRRPA